MDKLEGTSMDLIKMNVEKLKELFPNVVTEGKINFEVLKELLGEEVDDSKEKYQLSWKGKLNSIKLAQTPSSATLRPDVESSEDWDKTKNLYIQGDNLEVLKQLQKTYFNKIKMIYIDPPYNTGNDFIYHDDFRDSLQNYKQQTEQSSSSNPESNGRFHTDWLNMMYPRLLLAKNLLKNDGVIFISIDENEVNTLKFICNEIFGETNFVAELIWSAGRKNDSKHISISHEYILCYFKSAQYIKDNNIIWRERKQGLDDIYTKYNSLKKEFGIDTAGIEKELKLWFKGLPDVHPAKDHSHYSRVDENGIYFADNISWPGGGGPKYDILHPVTKKPVKIPSRGWLTNEENMMDWINQGRVAFGKDENSVPTLKSYLKDRELSVPYSVFYKDGRASSKRLASLMGDKVFENPKDEEIIQRLIEFSGTEEDDIVMDFFSGSGTTAHALFLANINQKVNRNFILVQLPELIDPNRGTEKSRKVAKNAVKLLDSLNTPHNLCEIGKERIRRSGKKINNEYIKKHTTLFSSNEKFNFDYGFKVFTLDSTNLQTWVNEDKLTEDNLFNYSKDIFKPDRSKKDILYEIMLKYGVFDMKVTEVNVNEKTLYQVGKKYMIVCLEDEITLGDINAIAELKPKTVIFKESGFSNDNDKINAVYNLEKAGVEDIKCI